MFLLPVWTHPNFIDLCNLYHLWYNAVCGPAGGTRERPWSVVLSPEDHSSLIIPSSRRHTNIMTFQSNNLSKSLSISNIAGWASLLLCVFVCCYSTILLKPIYFKLFLCNLVISFFVNIIWKLGIYNHLQICNIYDVIFSPSSPVLDEIPMKGLRFLSQSTDSLTRTNQVTESMESLTDEGQYLHSPLIWLDKTAADQPGASECKTEWMKIWYLYHWSRMFTSFLMWINK